MNKNRYDIFSELTVYQKASLTSFLKIFVKKRSKKNIYNWRLVYSDFINEVNFYIISGDNSYLWIKDYLTDDKFCKNIEEKIKYILIREKYKQSQILYVKKQKEFLKANKQKIKKFRQSKEKPTAKQISYYNSLCENLGIEKVDLTEKSKADLVEMIAEIKLRQGKNE